MPSDCTHREFTMYEARCDECGEFFAADDAIVLAYSAKARNRAKEREAILRRHMSRYQQEIADMKIKELGDE